MKDENYIVIQGWMVNKLKLKGNELILYALIYGFSQDNDSRFTGSLQYMADWTNSTKQGVSNALKSLVEKGYIEKHEIIRNKVKFCEYSVRNELTVLNKVEQGIKQSCIGGIKQSLTNNTNINNSNNNTIKKERKKTYDTAISEYTSNAEVSEALKAFIQMRTMMKKPLTDRALSLLLNKLDSLANNDTEKVELLNNAVMNNWLSVYPLKHEYSKPKQQAYDQNGYDADAELMKQLYGK